MRFRWCLFLAKSVDSGAFGLPIRNRLSSKQIFDRTVNFEIRRSVNSPRLSSFGLFSIAAVTQHSRGICACVAPSRTPRFSCAVQAQCTRVHYYSLNFVDHWCFNHCVPAWYRVEKPAALSNILVAPPRDVSSVLSHLDLRPQVRLYSYIYTHQYPQAPRVRLAPPAHHITVSPLFPSLPCHKPRIWSTERYRALDAVGPSSNLEQTANSNSLC